MGPTAEADTPAHSVTALQLKHLTRSRAGDIIQVTTPDGIVAATLVTYDRFNHMFQATIADNEESTFPASAICCPGKLKLNYTFTWTTLVCHVLMV
jgi:hypothetical protein